MYNSRLKYCYEIMKDKITKNMVTSQNFDILICGNNFNESTMKTMDAYRARFPLYLDYTFATILCFNTTRFMHFI